MNIGLDNNQLFRHLPSSSVIPAYCLGGMWRSRVESRTLLQNLKKVLLTPCGLTIYLQRTMRLMGLLSPALLEKTGAPYGAVRSLSIRLAPKSQPIHPEHRKSVAGTSSFHPYGSPGVRTQDLSGSATIPSSPSP